MTIFMIILRNNSYIFSIFNTVSELKGVVLELARTTSLLERTNRELRRKFRQVGSFGSEIGAKVAVYLQVSRLNGA